MKPKTMILMVVAIGCGLVASYMTSKVIGDNKNQAPAENKVKVLAAKQRLAPWTAVKDPSRYFEIKEVPDYAAPKRPLADLDKVKNQILGKAISEGAFLSEDDLLSKDQADLAGQMRPGDRATAVRVNPVSLAGGFVLPGSRVDVLATSRGNDPTTTTILQNMLVLAVDTKMVREQDSHSMLGSTATFSASPEEAQILTLAENTCELKLNLRPASDTKANRIQPTKFGDLGKQRQTEEERVEEEKIVKNNAPVPSVEPVKTVKEEKKVEKVPVVQEAKKPAPKPVKTIPTHTVKIINGRNLQKLVYQYDDEEKEWVLGGVQRKPEEPRADEEAAPVKDAEPAEGK